MNAPTVAARPALLDVWRDMRGIALCLAAGLLVLAVVFHQEIVSAVSVWIASTAYNHCFLVLPIAAYLVWDRRDSLRGVPIVPIPAVALAGIPVALVWLGAERLGIMEGRQLAAMTFIELLFLAVLGRRMYFALLGPLLYLYFLVPFGAFITPQLQDFTTAFVRVGLHLLHIPVYIDGYTIEIPQGAFYIAEACAGLRFLIASIAFGALYALVMYRSPLRRGLFILASLVVPVIANGFRALGIVVLGNVLGSAQAAATDHVLYGWMFFSIVILILIALGLPFRQDLSRPEPAPRPTVGRGPAEPRPLRPALFAAATVCVVAVISPAVALALEPAGPILPQAVSSLNFGAACIPADRTGAPLSDVRSPTRRINCNGLVLQVRMRVLPHRATAELVYGADRAMTAELRTNEQMDSGWIRPLAGQARTWRLLDTPDISDAMAVAVWVNGKPTLPGLRDRLRLAWTSLSGARIAPVVITVKPEVNWSTLGVEQRRSIEKQFIGVLRSWTDLTRQVKRIAGQS